MAQLIAYEFVSVDGLFEGASGHEMDFVREGFSPEIESDIAEQYSAVSAFVMGRVTFDKLASYWPTPAAREEALVKDMNAKRKLVLSHSDDVAAWSNSEWLGTDPWSALRERRQSERGDLMVIGSARVVRTLLELGLLDELRLLVFPTVLGEGRALFERSRPARKLNLVRTRQFDRGVLSLHYAVDSNR